MGLFQIPSFCTSPRKANQEKIEADERAENERIEQFARDKREREARFHFFHGVSHFLRWRKIHNWVAFNIWGGMNPFLK